MLPFKSSFLKIKIKLPVLWDRTNNSGIIDAVEHLQLQCFWHNYTFFICTIYVDHQKRMTLARKRCTGEQLMDSFTTYITFGLCPFSLWPKFFTTTFQKMIHMYSLISNVLWFYCTYVSFHFFPQKYGPFLPNFLKKICKFPTTLCSYTEFHPYLKIKKESMDIN
jgi:hypothetical protein